MKLSIIEESNITLMCRFLLTYYFNSVQPLVSDQKCVIARFAPPAHSTAKYSAITNKDRFMVRSDEDVWLIQQRAQVHTLL